MSALIIRGVVACSDCLRGSLQSFNKLSLAATSSPLSTSNSFVASEYTPLRKVLIWKMVWFLGMKKKTTI